MIKETGRVIAVEGGGVWVETIQQSACESCSAQKGCGQSLLAKATGKTTAIRVLPGDCNLQEVRVGDEVDIGIPEQVIVNGTLLVYLLPLLMMVVGAVVVGSAYEGDISTAIGGVLGLSGGSLLVRLHSYYNKNNNEVHPTLLG